MNNEAHREFRITPETIFTEVDTEDVIFQGERLTDARADQIVDDVRRANLVPGGKSLNGDGSHSRAISVRLPDSTRDALDSVADARGISSSKLVRQVLDDFLARTSDVDGSVSETTLKRRASRAVAGKHSTATGARKRSVAASNRRRRKSA